MILSINRIRKNGHTAVVSLPLHVREALGAKLGDSLAFRRVGRHVVMTVVRPACVLPISEAERQQARAWLGG